MSVKLEDMSSWASNVVKKLNLEAHPEGGWYRRDWQATELYSQKSKIEADCESKNLLSLNANHSSENCSASEPRPLASLIYFLLPKGDSSAWHKVDADELWLWHGPSNLILELGGCGEKPCEEEKRTKILLGAGISDSSSILQTPCGHAIVPANVWQRTIPGDGDTLVSCVVSPGFTFSGFNLA